MYINFIITGNMKVILFQGSSIRFHIESTYYIIKFLKVPSIYLLRREGKNNRE